MDKQRKQELAELKPTAEMMNEEQFWAIVQKAVDEAGKFLFSLFVHNIKFYLKVRKEISAPH